MAHYRSVDTDADHASSDTYPSNTTPSRHIGYTIEVICYSLASFILLLTLITQVLVYRFTLRRRWSRAKSQLLACGGIAILIAVPKNIDPNNMFGLMSFPVTHALALQITAMLIHCGALILLGSLRSLSLLHSKPVPRRISYTLIASTCAYHICVTAVAIYVGAIYSSDMKESEMYRILAIRDIAYSIVSFLMMLLAWYSLGQLHYLTRAHIHQLEEQEKKTKERVEMMRSATMKSTNGASSLATTTLNVVTKQLTVVDLHQKLNRSPSLSVGADIQAQRQPSHDVLINQQLVLPQQQPTLLVPQAVHSTNRSLSIDLSVPAPTLPPHLAHILLPRVSFLGPNSLPGRPQSSSIPPSPQQPRRVSFMSHHGANTTHSSSSSSAASGIIELNNAASKVLRFVLVISTLVILSILPAIITHGDYVVEDFLIRDRSKFIIGRCITAVMQYAGMSVVLWFAWSSPQVWMNVLKYGERGEFVRGVMHGVQEQQQQQHLHQQHYQQHPSGHLPPQGDSTLTQHTGPFMTRKSSKRVADLSILVPIPPTTLNSPSTDVHTPDTLPSCMLPFEVLAADQQQGQTPTLQQRKSDSDVMV